MTDERVDAGSGDSALTGPGIWTMPYLPVTFANLTVISMVAFDTLAIVAALPSISEDLGDVDLLPWVMTSYLATSAVAVIVAGPIIDAIGVRRTFRVTGIWFLVTSAACAVAPSMWALIAIRAVQGIGGGLVFSVALGSIGLAYPHALRPRAFTANSVVWGIMGFGGPALAGFLLAFGGWRLIFVIQLPITTVALVAGWMTLPSTRDRPAPIRTDWSGVGLIALLTAGSLMAVGQIGVRWWAAGAAVVVTALIGRAYWRHSGRTAEPVLAREHVSRFPHRMIHACAGLVLVIGLAVDNYVPLYIQTTRGRSVEFAAFSLVFLTIGWTVGSLVYSRILPRWREVDVILLGCLVMAPAVVASGLSIVLGWPLPALFGAFVVIGLSIGLVSTPALTLLQASSDESEMGRVNAAHQFVRTLCIMYGVALGGAILFLVVDVQVGDVEAVREVLAGEEVALGAETEDAIRDGLAWVHVVTGALVVGLIMVGFALQRRTRSPATSLASRANE